MATGERAGGRLRRMVRDAAPRDPGAVALRRGVRVVLVAPPVFAVLLEVANAPEAATFAAFAAFALLGFADFGGRARARARAYLTLGVVSAALVAIGTACSGHAWLAATVMLVVGAAIRFTGFFGGGFATAVSPAILAYVLGATVPAPASAIAGRLTGWAVASACATVAALVVLPRREHHLVASAAASACDALAADVDAQPNDGPVAAAADDVVAALGELRRVAATSRRQGPSAHALALTFLVDELRLLSLLVEEPNPFRDRTRTGDGRLGACAAVQLRAAAEVLRGRAAPDPETIDHDRLAARDEAIAAIADQLRRAGDPRQILATFDADYLDRLLLYLATSVRANAALLLTGRGPEERDVGRTLAPLETPTIAARATARRAVQLVRAHAVPTSAWLQDSVRAGVALGVAVLVAELASLDHAFWVALGTLAVLRSNAFDTGRNALEACAGTAVGFLLSFAFFAVVGIDRTALWAVTVVGFFLAAYVPQVEGFAAGQTAFTVLVVALFNLLEPAGWHTGAVRIGDVLVGASVGFGVGLVFWPRRAVDLVRSCVADLYAALAAWARAARPSFEDVGAAERRAHAAFAQYLDDRHGPRHSDAPWTTLLGVAGLGRTGVRFLAVHRAPLGTSPAHPLLDESTSALGATWDDIAAALAARTAPVHALPSADEVAARTRNIAIGAIERSGPDDADAVFVAGLWRGWLVEQAMLLRHAARAVTTLAAPEREPAGTTPALSLGEQPGA